jgi:hypothetical protein
MNFNQTQKLYWQMGKDNFILKIQDFKKLFILQLLTQISNAEWIKKCQFFTVHPNVLAPLINECCDSIMLFEIRIKRWIT